MSAPPLLSLPIETEAPVLGRLGSLETRLVRTEEEVIQAQELRFQIFFKENDAKNSTSTPQNDIDAFDPYCDHLLVLDDQKIVGTYRLLTQAKAKSAGGFYSQSEFDLSKMLTANPALNFLELGRSCIAPAYRNKRTMELLWHGTWAYALQSKIDVMFGCASFPGTDPEEFSDAFEWLGQNAVLSGDEDCTAISKENFPLNGFANEAGDIKKALSNLPPMLKGYLRLGAKVSRHAVIDRAFGTTDVLVVLKVADINPRYIAHYGADASRYAA